MEYNVFENYDNNLELRNAQIVYMYNILHMTTEEIAKYVNLALSTIKSYAYKFAHMLDKAKEWFGNKAKKIFDKLREKANVTDIVTYECDYRKGDCAYIIEYFDSQKNFTFLKVGMTNDINRRIKEHLRDYTKKDFDTTYAVVKKLYFAEDEEDALTLENLLRKHYKKIPDNGFIKRDRFSKVRFDCAELENDKDLFQKMEMFTVPV